MIAVKFKGGLGNQLFQYSTARALIKNADRLLLDISEYKQDYLGRTFKLHNYKIKGIQISNQNILRLFRKGSKLNRIVSKLRLFKNIKEEGFRFHDSLSEDLNYLTSVEGYWQSEEYFKNIREDLLKEIQPKEIPKFPAFIGQENSIAVHIRRTDYLQDARYGFLGEQYYNDSIAYCKENGLAMVITSLRHFKH